MSSKILNDVQFSLLQFDALSITTKLVIQLAISNFVVQMKLYKTHVQFRLSFKKRGHQFINIERVNTLI